MPNSRPDNTQELEQILISAGCNGPYDQVHRCSNLHCEHCGVCDAIPAIQALITRKQDEREQETIDRMISHFEQLDSNKRLPVTNNPRESVLYELRAFRTLRSNQKESQ